MLVLVRPDKGDEVPLTNFTARIVAVEKRTDGRTLYLLKVTLGKKITEVRVEAKAFRAMHWPADHFGPSAIVYPRGREHAAVAIQTLSGKFTSTVPIA